MFKRKPWTGGTKEEYETQHFGFGSQRLKIAVRQMIEEKITSGVKEMESYLQESLGLNETDKATLTHSCNKLIGLYCERAGGSLEKIDEEIERILEVPPGVLLPGDEVQAEQVSDAEYNKLVEEVAALQLSVQRGALMDALLTAEEEELSSVEKVCEAAKKDMEVLDLLHKHMENTPNLKSLQSDTQFLCASIPFMKNSDDSLDD